MQILICKKNSMVKFVLNWSLLKVYFSIGIYWNVVNLFWYIKLFLWFRFQFPPAPASSSIPQWQLLKNTKSQVEQQDKINSSDVPNSLQTSEKIILNDIQKSSTVDLQLNGVISSDNDKDCIIINSTSETPLPTSSNQNCIIPKDVNGVNNSEHIENNEGIHHWPEIFECEKYIFQLSTMKII